MDNIRGALYEKTGGFIKGICHPHEKYDLLRSAGLEWVRRDLPYPLNADGTWSKDYLEYKEACRVYAAHGLRHVTVTPYPRHFLKYGVDIRTEEGLAQAEEICARVAADFAELGCCWQVTNEMHIRHFRAPLNETQAKNFLIACIKGIKRGDPRAAVGHNSTDEEWLPICREIEAAVGGCDYIGGDLYDGPWTHGGPDTFVPFIDHVYAEIGLPVILMEFGFASRGGMMADADAEVDAYLRARGFAGEQDMLARLDDFIATLSEPIRVHVERCVPEDRVACIRSDFPHIMKKWTANCPISHDEEGQAQFYRELLPQLLANPHLGGAVIYCLRDSKCCFFCDEADCPCETAWGLIRCDDTKKPAYDAVQAVFGKK